MSYPHVSHIRVIARQKMHWQAEAAKAITTLIQRYKRSDPRFYRGISKRLYSQGHYEYYAKFFVVRVPGYWNFASQMDLQFALNRLRPFQSEGPLPTISR